MSKKLTIVFPAYNDHIQLERALCALRDQTWKDFDVVILDDVATRPYDDLATTFTDLNIQIVRNEQNLGAMGNMWQSIQFPVETPYIMSHHTDDFLKTDYLERAITLLDAHPNLSFVLTGPEWVNLDTPYHAQHTKDKGVTTFDAADFARYVLQLAPYMFGSVVYRATHRVPKWDFDRFNILCDRYFLGSILRIHASTGAFLKGSGIFERDHAQDPSDGRLSGLDSNHIRELLLFYQTLLHPKYSSRKISVLITNYALFALQSLQRTGPYRHIYTRFLQQSLIHLSSIRWLGLYSIALQGVRVFKGR